MLLAQEAAQMLRLPKARIYELVRQGRLPAVRVGRLVRIPEDELRAWIARGGTPLLEYEEASVAG
jgi:excisionase family DNA binding protein